MDILHTLIQARPSGTYTITVESSGNVAEKVVVKVTTTLDADGKTMNVKIEPLEGIY